MTEILRPALPVGPGVDAQEAAPAPKLRDLPVQRQAPKAEGNGHRTTFAAPQRTDLSFMTDAQPMNGFTGTLLATGLLASLLVCLTHSMAMAQSADTASPSSSQEVPGSDGSAPLPSAPITLDPVTVSARKTDEQLKDVPESITVLPAGKLEASPLDPGVAISQNAPNVQWTNKMVGQQFFSIRGVSSLGAPASYSDGTIGFDVDGVPNNMMSASNALLDVKRIEVLRGPQGTLWGTNALGGAINVITNQPDGTRDIHFTTEMGSNGYRLGEGVVGGNILPGVLDGRMAVRYTNYDGDITGQHTDELNAREIGAFRGGLRYTGRDGTSVTLAQSYSHDQSNQPFYLLRDTENFPISGSLTEPDLTSTSAATTATLEHEFDALKLTTVSAYQYNKLDSRLDATDDLVYPGYPSIPTYLKDDNDVFSQEVRLSSLEGAPIRWVTGVSAGRDEIKRICKAYNCLPSPYSLASYSDMITLYTKVHTTNLGLFGDITVPLGNSWEVSVGGRVSHDDTKIRIRNSAGDAGLTGENATSETYLTGRSALTYKWNDDARSYVSIARGHSSRQFPLFGYPDNGVVADAYPSATSVTYEAGSKFDLLNNRLQVDASVFHNDVKDGILTYYDPNIAGFGTTYQDYRTYGFEVQTRALITERLTFIGGLGYTHTKLGANGKDTATAGNKVPNIPEWTANAALQYDTSAKVISLPGDLSFGLEYQYTGSRSADVNRSFDLSSYSIVNAKAGWSNDADDFDLYIFGRNLFDKRYELYGAPSNTYQPTVSVSRGRIVGAGLTKRF